jgi:hypothetical protein
MKLQAIAFWSSLLFSPMVFAQPAQAPTPALGRTLVVKLTIASGGATRVHELSVAEQRCNQVEETGKTFEDEVRICAHPRGTAFEIETQWKTRNNGFLYKATSEVVLAKGGRAEIGRSGGTRFALEVL